MFFDKKSSQEEFNECISVTQIGEIKEEKTLTLNL